MDGYWYRVDQHGTHPLGRDPDPTGYDEPPSLSADAPVAHASPYERALAQLIAAA